MRVHNGALEIYKPMTISTSEQALSFDSFSISPPARESLVRLECSLGQRAWCDAPLRHVEEGTVRGNFGARQTPYTAAQSRRTRLSLAWCEPCTPPRLLENQGSHKPYNIKGLQV